MIDIEIRPAFGATKGRLTAAGHAESGKPGEFDPVCCAVTTLIGALQSNLDRCTGVTCKVHSKAGYGLLIWGRQRKAGRCALNRANSAAGFVYNTLKDLEREHPNALRVHWQPAAPKEESL